MRNKQRKQKAKNLSRLGLKKSLRKKRSLSRFIKSGFKRKGYDYKECPHCGHSWYKIASVDEQGITEFRCNQCDHVWADDKSGSYWASIQKRHLARSRGKEGGPSGD